MPEYVRTYALLFVLIFCKLCQGQDKTDPSTGNVKSIFSFGPNTIVRTVKQDKKGNIWMASWHGVFRYDGKSFTNITSKVSSARFFSILEDRKGNFWFGSIGSGVYYYDGKSFRNITTKDGLPNNEVTCIYEDTSGKIWFGVNGGASCYDGKSFRNYLMNGDSMSEDKTGKTFPDFTRPPNEVNSIIEDKTGKFWFATRGNTFVYDVLQRKTFTVFTHNGQPFQNVRCIIEDKKGAIWLGGMDGLWRYDGSISTIISQNFVGYIYEDKKGNIWTSSEKANNRKWALSRYDEKWFDLTEIRSNEKMIFGILEARNGDIWFGTLNGVYRYDGITFEGF